MADEWLLVETLGDEPVVVATGARLTPIVPLTAFLRRTPGAADLGSAINETIASRRGLSSASTRRRHVIRTEPVIMSDGRLHGVQLWSGLVDASPPPRPTPGPLKWDVTAGLATDTAESLANSGNDASGAALSGRAFSGDLPERALRPVERSVLAAAIDMPSGRPLATVFETTDQAGTPITVAFVARVGREVAGDRREHVVVRAMNLRAATGDAPA